VSGEDLLSPFKKLQLCYNCQTELVQGSVRLTIMILNCKNKFRHNLPFFLFTVKIFLFLAVKV